MLQVCTTFYSMLFRIHFIYFTSVDDLPSVLWRCWLGSRKGIRPVKTEWWDAGMVICLGEMQICIWPSRCHCCSLSLAPVNPDWFCLLGFTFLVLAYPGSPRQNPESRKTVVVVGLVTCAHGLSRSYIFMVWWDDWELWWLFSTQPIASKHWW